MNAERWAAVTLGAAGLVGASGYAMHAEPAPRPAHAVRAPRAHVAPARRLHAPRSVWDSVYTEEQAQRGEAIYRESCSKCHGATLDGIDDAKPLAGSEFLSNWSGLSVHDVVERIRQSMPPSDPGLLNRPQTVDVVAYILFFNKFPAGKTELDRDAEVLKQIRIEATRP